MQSLLTIHFVENEVLVPIWKINMTKKRRNKKIINKAERKSTRGYGFRTSPVFLAAISTILGAILFLRFGYATAHAGVAGALFIIILRHAITIPTALAIAEIATNLKVQGGGEYFMISRSFWADAWRNHRDIPLLFPGHFSGLLYV